ncbi:ATP-binding protein involved in chromosome partitioning [Cryobacterium mesophilum]|uniref:Mrp/NBP35 family ATP-binding protein n=1 Tax=Terrimesophilobacter mesophilus TaxID=433647 RepID=UPI0017B7946E|nr:Mrp/NBP35 family ATP-binding protein [Terrimesophilobacter mesophilus]MBB5633845.1 ATP-binding protein involved in chromosome partitioning [Terrimesophilobacter mesophilus]
MIDGATVDRAALDRALGTVIDPEIRRPIADLGMIDSVTIDGGSVTIRIKLTIVGCPAADRIEHDVREAASAVAGVTEVAVDVAVMSVEERTALTERLQGARRREVQFGPDTPTRIVAITSGKGGVGKSTITANLGAALAAKGLKVGIVDADVFGFSIPALLGVSDEKPTRVGELMLPPIGFGVKVISIGMFLPGPATAVSWRGPMLHRTIKQFLSEVYFDELDVLLLDLPPGTGDVAISIGQLLPHAEVVVVTTPQTAAADVAERSGIVARKTGQRVIGVVENMAGLPQPDGTVLDLFGTGGGADAAARLDVPLLMSIPLSLALREGGDAGDPVVLSHPDDPAARAILALADVLVS